MPMKPCRVCGTTLSSDIRAECPACCAADPFQREFRQMLAIVIVLSVIAIYVWLYALGLVPGLNDLIHP